MSDADMEINALIGSRICHDLISPLGAIGNGVELLSMTGMTAAPEIALITESVENANARIRFFRIAFGAAAPDATLGNTEVRSVLTDLYRGNRLSVEWRLDTDTLRRETKLAFLILQCFESALPWGGKVAVTRSGETWSIFGSGDRIKHDQELWHLFETPRKAPDIRPADVHFALVAPAAKSLGRNVKASFNGNAISVSF